jgi:hypothetical protein
MARVAKRSDELEESFMMLYVINKNAYVQGMAISSLNVLVKR